MANLVKEKITLGGNDLTQTLQNTNADKPSMSFATASSNVTSANDLRLLLGLSDATVIATASSTIDASSGAARKYLAYFGGDQDFGISLAPSSNSLQSYQASGFVDTGFSLPGKNIPFTLVLTRFGGNVKAHLNGVAGAVVPQTASNPVSFMAAIVGNSGTAAWQGQVNRCLYFNYKLSDTKISYYSAGGRLLAEDVGGSMVDKVGTGSWADAGGATFTGSGRTITSVAGGAVYIAMTGTIPAGKRVKVRLNATGFTGIAKVAITDGGFAPQSNEILMTAGAVELIFTTTGSTGQYITIGSGPPWTATSLAITDAIVLGALVAYEPEGITQTQQWLDLSGNYLHGTVSGAQPQNVNTAVSFSRSKTVTVSGLSTSPQITIQQVRVGNIVTLKIPALGKLTKDGTNGSLYFAIDPEFTTSTLDTWVPGFSTIGNVAQVGTWRIVGATVQMWGSPTGGFINATQVNNGWELPNQLTYSLV